MAASKPVNLLYKPFGIVGGIVAGKVAKTIVDKAWAATRHEGTTPTPRDPSSSMAQVVLAGVISGAAFTGSRAAFERLAAGAFQRWSGEWPDDTPAPKKQKD